MEEYQPLLNIKTTNGSKLVIWRKKNIVFLQYFTMENILSLAATVILEGKWI